jgi:DNA-binding transcriptional LysR family regulator
MPVLAEIHARYPDINLELVADNRVLSLTKREADIAIRIGVRAEPQLVVRKVAMMSFGVYASSSYLAARGRPHRPGSDGHVFVNEASWGHDFIADEPMCGPPDTAWIGYRGAGTRTSFRSQSTLACLEAAATGMGIALLPCYLGETDPRLERIGEATAPAPIVLLLHRDLQHASRIRACCDMLVLGIQAQADLLAGKPSHPVTPKGRDVVASAPARRPKARSRAKR